MKKQKINQLQQNKLNINNQETLDKIITYQKNFQERNIKKQFQTQTRPITQNETGEKLKNESENKEKQDENLNLKMGNEKIEKKGKKSNRIKFDENLLLFSENGIKKLYDEMEKFEEKLKKHVISFPIPNQERSDYDLNNLMNIYKSWHFSLFSKVDFDYFINKLHSLGSKQGCKEYMKRLRRIYNNEHTWEMLFQEKDLILNSIPRQKDNEFHMINPEDDDKFMSKEEFYGIGEYENEEKVGCENENNNNEFDVNEDDYEVFNE